MNKESIESVLASVGLESLRKNQSIDSEEAKSIGEGDKLMKKINRGAEMAKKPKQEKQIPQA
jgi:hypothetical protein